MAGTPEDLDAMLMPEGITANPGLGELLSAGTSEPGAKDLNVHSAMEEDVSPDPLDFQGSQSQAAAAGAADARRSPSASAPSPQQGQTPAAEAPLRTSSRKRVATEAAQRMAEAAAQRAPSVQRTTSVSGSGAVDDAEPAAKRIKVEFDAAPPVSLQPGVVLWKLYSSNSGASNGGDSSSSWPAAAGQSPQMLAVFNGSLERFSMYAERKEGELVALPSEYVDAAGPVPILICPGLCKQEGQVMVPASLGEMVAYFQKVLTLQPAGGDSARTPAPPRPAGPGGASGLPPAVFIAIVCENTKAWLTYEPDEAGEAPTPIVVYDEKGLLVETTPAQFEGHIAHCSSKKWRNSFKSTGMMKLAVKGKPLVAATVSDVLASLKGILGISNLVIPGDKVVAKKGAGTGVAQSTSQAGTPAGPAAAAAAAGASAPGSGPGATAAPAANGMAVPGLPAVATVPAGSQNREAALSLIRSLQGGACNPAPGGAAAGRVGGGLTPAPAVALDGRRGGMAPAPAGSGAAAAAAAAGAPGGMAWPGGSALGMESDKGRGPAPSSSGMLPGRAAAAGAGPGAKPGSAGWRPVAASSTGDGASPGGPLDLTRRGTHAGSGTSRALAAPSMLAPGSAMVAVAAPLQAGGGYAMSDPQSGTAAFVSLADMPLMGPPLTTVEVQVIQLVCGMVSGSDLAFAMKGIMDAALAARGLPALMGGTLTASQSHALALPMGGAMAAAAPADAEPAAAADEARTALLAGGRQQAAAPDSSRDCGRPPPSPPAPQQQQQAGSMDAMVQASPGHAGLQESVCEQEG